jgi:hypothetical protein
MQIICAWCHQPMHKDPDCGATNPQDKAGVSGLCRSLHSDFKPASHGICDACYAREMAALARLKTVKEVPHAY